MKTNKNILSIGLLACLPISVFAGEGGGAHVMPGATATLADLPPTTPGTYIKPMYMNYNAGASVAIPTAAGVTSDLDVTANTFAVALVHSFETKVLGGANYTMAVALPFTSLDISGNVQLPNGGQVARGNSVSGFGDLTVLPVMLAWKRESWTYMATLPIYIPTGNYELGRLGNTGLNYWTVDPTVGFMYSTKKGLNSILLMGYAMNGENEDTNYKSGSMLHIEGTIEQIIPVGKGLMTFGLEAFYYDQLTGDSGSGATLGDFKGMTTGVGPLIGYIKPMGKQNLVLEAKWLTELDTKNRVEGDMIWLKAVYKF
jgi:hypothetical protein